MSDRKTDGGGLAADVSDDVIKAALESVERAVAPKPSSPSKPLASSASKPPPDGEVPDVAVLEKDLREVRAQLDLSVERARETLDRLKDTHERYVRAAADLDNYKKRAVREKEEAEKFGIQKLLKDMLPVLDNLDRALAHAEANNPLAEGVQATRRIFEDTLARYGVKCFTAVGQPFDPTRHEAMQQIETAEQPPGTVVSEMVRGYTLHDRLVRPALVAVAAAPADSTNPPPGAAELKGAGEA